MRQGEESRSQNQALHLGPAPIKCGVIAVLLAWIVAPTHAGLTGDVDLLKVAAQAHRSNRLAQSFGSDGWQWLRVEKALHQL